MRPEGASSEAPDAQSGTDNAAAPTALTEPQIAWLVDRYKLEMARYEKAATLVGERLRRELRQAGVKHMVSARAKHPADLAGKLKKKAADPKKAPQYKWEVLKEGLGSVVTDLAGCRVAVYSAADEEAVAALVPRVFAQPKRDDAAVDRRRQLDEAYWATHALVHPYSEGENTDMTVESAICELQVVTVAAHLFNEIEHDITYKDRDAGLKPSDDEKQIIVELRGVARVADRLVTELLQIRAKRRHELSHVIEDAEDLRFTLSQLAERNFDGTELGRLHRLLEQCLQPVTPAALRGLGRVDDLIDAGRHRLGEEAADYGDEVLYSIGLLDQFEPEIRLAVGSWKGPRTPMRRALEAALTGRQQSGEQS